MKFGVCLACFLFFLLYTRIILKDAILNRNNDEVLHMSGLFSLFFTIYQNNIKRYHIKEDQ